MEEAMVARLTSTDGVFLPPLPESQLARPPSVPGRAIPSDGSHLQVSAFSCVSVCSVDSLIQDSSFTHCLCVCVLPGHQSMRHRVQFRSATQNFEHMKATTTYETS